MGIVWLKKAGGLFPDVPKLNLLAENPFHPSLRTKKIQGTTDLFECSINMDIRIIWYYECDKIIILVDVGHHDILKQF